MWKPGLGCIAVGCLMFIGLADAQENWDRFRGPNGTGVQQAALPDQWSADDFRWSIKLPGSGSSSPVVWGDLLVITSCQADTAQVTLTALDAKTGQTRWEKAFAGTPYRLHGRNSFAASTPAMDAQRIYLATADPDHTRLIALDHEGDTVWERDLGTWISQHGFSMSPMVVGERLIFVNSQQADRVPANRQPGASRVLAFNAKTGEDLWQVPLKATRACYSVPAIVETDAGGQLVGTNTGNGFYSIDLASGRLNWSGEPFRMRTVASAVVVDNLVVGSCGSGGGGNYLVTASMSETGVEPKYTIKQSANYVPTPLAWDGNLYLFGDKGVGTCVDLETGEVHWRERVSRGFSGSPVCDGKRIYIMDESGTVHVVAASKTYSVLNRVDLGEDSRATPAIAGGAIYFRTESQLHRLDAAGDRQ